MSKLLITGIPGTGKTCIGNTYEEKGYEHIDVEKLPYDKIFPDPAQLLDYLDTQNENRIITWGFPAQDIETNIIIHLKNRGFKLFWFDSDRNSALNAFIIREIKKNPAVVIQEKISAFHDQVSRIDAFQVISKIQPIIINPFNEEYRFKKPDEILKEIEGSLK